MMIPATVHSSSVLHRTLLLQHMGKFLVLLLLVVVLFSCSSSNPTFNPNKKYTQQLLQQDYTLFQHILEERHPSLYWYSSKNRIDSAFHWGLQMITDSMTETGFRKILAAVVSNIQCGHTSVRASKEYQKYLDTITIKQNFPLTIKTWKDTITLTTPVKGTSLQRGDIIDSINGIAASNLIDTLFRFIPADGGNAVAKSQLLSGRNYFSSLYTSIFGWPREFRIAYRDSTNSVQQAVIKPLIAPKDSVVEMGIVRKKKKSRAEKLKEQRSLALYKNLHYAVMPLNSFSGKLRLKPFFRRSFKTLADSGIKTLVIDLRTNGGGRVSNSTFITRYLATRPFKLGDSLYAISSSSQYSKYIKNDWLQKIYIKMISKKIDGQYRNRFFEKHCYKPKHCHHFNGQIYLLSGGYTYSASVLVLHVLKNQPNVFIVGEPSGGAAYGNSAMFIPDVTLPNTHIRFRLPLFRLVIDTSLPQNGQGVPPDIFVSPSPDAIRRGEDYKMQKVKDLIEKSNQL